MYHRSENMFPMALGFYLFLYVQFISWVNRNADEGVIDHKDSMFDSLWNIRELMAYDANNSLQCCIQTTRSLEVHRSITTPRLWLMGLQERVCEYKHIPTCRLSNPIENSLRPFQCMTPRKANFQSAAHFHICLYSLIHPPLQLSCQTNQWQLNSPK